ncbi:PhzF family phenazine biosynthesis protein [bacterium]|nr:PhzF family phenazine biosynthesis protein [bacterium]MCI0603637.1 PhzF family phenazine biosynthesis protein [bacterium]
MGQKITQVDAFTGEPFKGNPAAVCVLLEPKEDQWMKLVAREMNLAETAYLLREGEGYRLRWFTPATKEVRLCGHATLASAHVLWEEGFLKREETARFLSLSGPLSAKWIEGWIELDFPRLNVEPMPAPDGLLKGLEVPVKFSGKSMQTWLVEVESEEIVRKLSPDFRLLKTLDRDVLVTGASKSKDFDFVSRYFAPRHAIDEDPVTGSAHCVLGPYWAEKLGKNELHAYQASERGGFLRVRVTGDRVYLLGQAVTVMRGELI